MPLIHGIDVSYAQGNVDWASVSDAGNVRFVYSRVSYGENPADDDGAVFRRNHDECKQFGIPFGCYHFFRFDQSGAAQASHFLSQANGRYGTLRAMVDVEEGSGSGESVAQMIENLSTFVTAVERVVKSPMIIYTNANTWNNQLSGSDAFSGHQLWVSNFTRDPNIPPAMPNGFRDWTLYQFSDNGTVPVIAADGGRSSVAVDLDVLKGRLSAIRRTL